MGVLCKSSASQQRERGAEELVHVQWPLMGSKVIGSKVIGSKVMGSEVDGKQRNGKQRDEVVKRRATACTT